MDKREAVSEIVKRHKEKQALTWDGMAETINWTTLLDSQVSRSQVNNWGVGVGVPEYYFTVHLFLYGAEPWVKNMAKEILAVLKPGLWA